LLEDGHEIHALVRPGSDRGTLPPEVRLIRGDVRNLETMRSLVSGCDVAVHLAASFSSRDDVEEIIVSGTRNMVAAAKSADISRIVMVSCLGAAASNASPFYAAKWEAEQLVRGQDVPYAILRPSVIMGADDALTRPLAQIIRVLPVVPLPGQGEYRQQPVDVDDVARCIAMTLTGEDLVNQEISIGGPTFLTYRQLVDLLQGILGVSKPKIPLPPDWLPDLARVFPAASKELFAAARIARFQQMSAASPGIVERNFGFEPRSIVPLLPGYIA
jgi:uncharacterized protein YbjT (DUF2867 family)